MFKREGVDRVKNNMDKFKLNNKKEGVSGFSITSLNIHVFIMGVLIGGVMSGLLSVALNRLLDSTVFLLEILMGV